MNPLISVIVPVYNTEKYLRKCLDSICGQTYRSLEILCVNDGSTDSSAAILKEYAAKDARIKIINRPNGGLAAARNTGLQHTSGKWVTGVDSDDYLDIDAIEYMLQGESDECDIIFSGAIMEWSDCSPEEGSDYNPSSTLDGEFKVTDELLKSTYHEFCGKLWRVSFLRQHSCLFPEGLWYEDWYFFWAFAPLARAISFRSTPKYHYVRRSDSIMGKTTQKPAKAFDYMIIMSKLLEHRRLHPLPKAWGELTLSNFVYCMHCALSRVPNQLIPRVHEFCISLVKQYQLHKQFKYFVSLLPVPWYLKPFISHKEGKITYKFLGIPIISSNYRRNPCCTRLFGIKIN